MNEMTTLQTIENGAAVVANVFKQIPKDIDFLKITIEFGKYDGPVTRHMVKMFSNGSVSHWITKPVH